MCEWRNNLPRHGISYILKNNTHRSGAEYLVFRRENRALKKKFGGVMCFYKVTQKIFMGIAENTLSNKNHLGAQSLTNWPLAYFSGADSKGNGADCYNSSHAWLHLHPKCNSSNARRISAIIDHHWCSANTHRLWSWYRAPNVFLFCSYSSRDAGPRLFTCYELKSRIYLATGSAHFPITLIRGAVCISWFSTFYDIKVLKFTLYIDFNRIQSFLLENKNSSFKKLPIPVYFVDSIF